MGPVSRETPAEQVNLLLSELVLLTAVPASTIHHYRRAGLIPPPRRMAANRFCYDERHVDALRMIRLLRDRKSLSLEEIALQLPALLAADSPQAAQPDAESNVVDVVADARARVIEAAIDAFRTRSYGEVTMGAVAHAAGVAKGSVYRYFACKEELFESVIESLLADTATSFAAAVEALGGPAGVAQDPHQAHLVFAGLVAGAMPILLELGARAAKGHDPSEELARRVLRTLAEAAGAPLSDDPVPAGLNLLQGAFGMVLGWAVGPDWPPDLYEGEV